MRVRWSQLVYRHPGSDNEVGLARVCESWNGEVMRFNGEQEQIGDDCKGYLALIPVSQGMEEELDEWVDIEPSVFFEKKETGWDKASKPLSKKLSLHSLIMQGVNTIHATKSKVSSCIEGVFRK